MSLVSVRLLFHIIFIHLGLLGTSIFAMFYICVIRVIRDWPLEKARSAGLNQLYISNNNIDLSG